MLKTRFLACALIALPSFCVQTKFWQQDNFANIEKGTLNKLSLRSDGRLFLAPVVKELFDSSTPYLWAVAQDSKGVLYVGGGGPNGSKTKLFTVDAAGKATTVAEIDGLEIHALAIDRNDRVYAATNPDGKVYRIVNGKPEVFYDPKAKYIWALAFGPNSDLFVATGDQGEIHRVTANGGGSVFFRTEETHARSLAIDTKGNIIVGTEPGGLVLRITPAGDGFVLYQTPKREVTAVAVGLDGSVYAAGVGNRSSGPTLAVPAPSLPPAPAAASAAATGGIQIVTTSPRPGGAAPPPTLSSGSLAPSGGSEIYRIYADGSPRKVWTHAQDIAYAIAFDEEGRPLIGTGNKGALYRLDSDVLYTLLANVAPTQVTAFGAGRNGQLFAVSGNIGKLYQVGPAFERQGTFESETLDAGGFTYWGRLAYTGDLAGGKLSLESRSGNVSHPQKNWSSWTPVTLQGDGGRVSSPPARFLQYKLTLSAGSDARSPEITSIEAAYLPKNLAPVIREIEATPANYKFSSASNPLLTSNPQSLTLPAMGQPKRPNTSANVDLSSSSQTMAYAKGSIGVRWLASDENGDTLTFKVEIRGVNESQWKLLRDKVHDKYLSWDSTAFQDGKYVVRVTASDSPSNPPGQALSATLVGDPFQIDNTPPQITGLAGSTAGNKINVQWRAKDALSVIDKAEYSINGGDWMVAEPVTKLSDAPELDYKISIDRPAPGEYTIAVRVTDEYDNQSVEKVVVR